VRIDQLWSALTCQRYQHPTAGCPPESGDESPHSKLTALSFASLLNNPTKLAKPKFFIRSQQRTLRVQNPVVTPPKILDVALAAAKKFAQEAFRPIAID
jgi:hypothetical protein